MFGMCMRPGQLQKFGISWHAVREAIGRRPRQLQKFGVSQEDPSRTQKARAFSYEGHCKMLEKARQCNWIQGFSVGSITCNPVIIFHQLYADDTLIFCETDRSQTLYLNLNLTLFLSEALNGLQINKQKSIVYPANAGSQY
ncbi:hypothetical protein H5410_022284 [Solanum commersonii]|uniref:Reverse transcriptase domain-containing protein n=1 Tax=Solanum commersonii TaxID=4109 RepID=A0A9J5ZDI9_SOLCO|nr:hypothetical protein H5410_022284 [Solanum commersonii]